MNQKDKNKLAMLIGGEIAEFNKGNRDCNYVVNFIEKREKRIGLEAKIEELENWQKFKKKYQFEGLIGVPRFTERIKLLKQQLSKLKNEPKR